MASVMETSLRPDPPAGYTVRPATMAVLVPVATMLGDADVADTGSAETTPETLRGEWEDPYLDLSKDTWLVHPGASEGETGPAPVAYAMLIGLDHHRQLQSRGVIHPSRRGRGIGWFLMDVLEARAAEHVPLADPESRVVLHDGTGAQDRAGHRLLEERGYAPVRHFWRMEAPLEDPAGAGEFPGLRLRTFVLGQDDRAFHRAIQESFADHWGFMARGFDEWAAHRLHEYGFDPDLWWVVEEGDEVVAVLQGKIIDEVGWVDMLGTRARWRKRGIAEALLRHAFLEFRRRGCHAVRLGVDAANETGATALYERVGMHVARQFDVYEKRLR